MKLYFVSIYPTNGYPLDLLIEMGYSGTRKNARQTIGQSRDGGVDGIINEDRLGLDVIHIQAGKTLG
ncbi:restriction endonuclease [Mastigocoleus testarum]|uniref:restriction endonuclease n=1 Tax=Mastigocoleus testarum TaxID=996925 RepID=UPI0004284D8C|nr:restriction endonuclease [Mastigocoleus testarum]